MANQHAVLRIKPNHYIHVLNNNTNVTSVIVGPKTFTRQEHEQVLFGPDPMVMIPPRHYCIITNPVCRDEDGQPIFFENGQVKLKHGDEEIKFSQEPFPLYPGERISGKPSPLQVVASDQGLKLRCLRDFVDQEGKERQAGDEWLFRGPATYIPRVEVQVVDVVRSIIIKEAQALKLRARRDCVDSDGKKRIAGEEWLVRESGAYLPEIDEETVGTISSHTLTANTALHLKATKTFEDVFKKTRRAGEEWLVTMNDCETHLPDVYEQVVSVVKITTLTDRQYCVVLDPVVDGKSKFGVRQLRVGEISFFLQPGERLEAGIQEIYVLPEEAALLLKAREDFDDNGEKRAAGDKWMVYGPCDYVPPIEVEVIERRKSIPLDENEGIYIRDIKDGKVRAEIGHTYMLKANEELWAKDLPASVEVLLKKASRDKDERGASDHDRDLTKVVTYRVPHNAAVQIYDYKVKESRVVYGPEQVMLGPDEHFTVMDLSGGIPKQAHQIQSIALFLGPDFMTDQVVVETSDHARLSLKLSINWHFEIDDEDPSKIFSNPDFVGDLCKAVGSLVRGAVASSTFDSFHKNSTSIIQDSVFGRNDDGELNDRLKFSANNLVITNIDVQSVEPIDQRTRDSLQKSVQLAIEITTKSQESEARHDAEREEQEAKGALERQKIHDKAEAEKSRKELLLLKAKTDAIRETGVATADARARAEAGQIEGEAEVVQSKLKADAQRIEFEGQLEQQQNRQVAEIAHLQQLNELEISKSQELAAIEAEKFKDIVSAIGADTIKSIAQAGPEMQAKLLKGLGLKSFMITDGNSPINLFNTASGLVAEQ